MLNKVKPGSSVIDCSCGTGFQAIWLAQKGYQVTAADISEGMVNEARNNASQEKVNIKFITSSYVDICNKVDQQFDFAMCYGNSFAHINSLEMLDNTMASMRKILKPDCYFMFDIHNWEKDIDNPLYDGQEIVIEKDGQKFKVRYEIEINGWLKKGCFTTIIRNLSDNTVQKFDSDFCPVQYVEIKKAILSNGFVNLEKRYIDNDMGYYVYAW